MFGPGASTEDIFDKVGAEIVESTLGGINGTIFAYGATGSGKTFTMEGVNEPPELRGERAAEPRAGQV